MFSFFRLPGDRYDTIASAMADLIQDPVETLLVLDVDIVEYLDKHLWPFGFTEEMLLDDIGVDDLFLFHEHSVNLADANPDGIQVFVQFEVSFRFSFGESFGCIPVLRLNTTVDVEFGSLTGDS